MCDPVSATALALSAGGSYLQQREANSNAKRVQNAKNDAYEANMIRQRQYADEAGAAFTQNVEGQSRENFDEQQGAETERFKQAFAERKTQPDYNIGLSGSTPKNVVLNRQREAEQADNETNRDVNNLANLNAFGGALFNQGLNRSEFGRKFGNIQDTASRDSRLLGLDLQSAANNAQKSPSLFPTLLKTGGQALGLYNAGGGFNGSTLGNQSIDAGDFLKAGARKDIGYSLQGGYGPYRY